LPVAASREAAELGARRRGDALHREAGRELAQQLSAAGAGALLERLRSAPIDAVR